MTLTMKFKNKMSFNLGGILSKVIYINDTFLFMFSNLNHYVGLFVGYDYDCSSSNANTAVTSVKQKSSINQNTQSSSATQTSSKNEKVLFS